MKKLHTEKLRIYLIILVLLVASIFLISCLNWIIERPSFALRGVTLRPLSFTEMNLLFDLEVQNQNSFNLTLQSFDYTIYLENEEIGSGRLQKELEVPASSTTLIRVPLVARFKNLSAILKAVLTQGDLSYKIEGNADIKSVFGSRKFPFSSEGCINLKK